MAGTDHLAIAELGPEAALEGLELSAEAHWNQSEADWRFFLGRGTVFGIRDRDGHLIATAALLPYTSGNAWVSMVLVTESWRRRGLATRLIDSCLATAAKRGLTTWLDATPAGAAVYGPLGFEPTLQLRRLRFENATPPAAGISQSSPTCSVDEFIARDTTVMGFDRSMLLAELAGRADSRLLSGDNAVALLRGGRKAGHIGPLFAGAPDQAVALVQDIVGSTTGPLLIDAVSTQDDFLRRLAGSGWSIERPFQRMRFGHPTAPPAELPFAVAGPEYG